MDELHFAKAFDHSPVGMAFLKADGTVLSANPALVDMLGKPLWSVVGSNLEDHLRPGDKDLWQEFLDRFRASPVSNDSFESAYVPVDGMEAWWSLNLSDLDQPWAGEATYFAVLQDVTFRRAAEQKLREARRLAEGASRAKSEFLANMSHEIRTPLFTIIGMTDLLRLGDLKRDQVHHAGQIAGAAGHLLELVNDVLDFSKIEAGQMSLESIPLDLDEVVGRSLEVVSLSAYRKGLELVLDIDPEVPRNWLGDPARLRQVLVNLLGNAVKFTPQGRVSLTVGPGPTFRIRDTGIGISESARANLFQVFTQADSSTTRQFGGTGLGLAISQKLVGLLGGTIDFTSSPGKGTEFFFTLAMPADGPSEPPAGVAGSPTVLVVDDDPLVREVLGRRLSGAGFAVQTAPDRAQAHRALASRRPDLVLIDQELGSEDGWQLASEVRADPRTRDLPLVLMSLLRKTLEPSPRYPADLFRCFIDKPVNPRLLVETLNRGLSGTWSDAGARETSSLLNRALLARSSERLRVLVAEDHEVNRELFRLLLHSLGHHVLLVENGREACEAGPGFRPQLVFMDLQMPEMNGYEAARELRRLGLNCPVVAVTASALKGELERCREAGMNGILTKPFNLDTLASVIRSYSPRAVLAASDPTVPEVAPEASDAPTADETLGAFAIDEALRTFLGNRELLAKVVAQFLVKSAAAVEALEVLSAAGDRSGLRSGAHALKGSAANLAALPLSRAAEALELAAIDNRLEDTPALVAAVRRAYQAFSAATKGFA